MLTLAAADTIGGVAGTATAVTYSIYGMTLASGVETYLRLAQGQLAISAGTLYTVASSTTAFVKQICLANATGSAVSGVILYNGGTAATNQITGSFTIPANGTALLDDNGLQIYDSTGNLQTTGTNSFGSTIGQVTTPLALGVAGTATLAARADHQHQSPGGIAAITGASGAINSTETSIVSATVPANFVVAGTSFRIKISGTCTSTVANTCNFRVRWGAAGNSGDTQLANLTTTAATSGTTIQFWVEFMVTFRSTTVAEVSGYFLNQGVTGVSATAVVVLSPTNTTSLTTTSTEILQFSYQTTTNATTTCTFQSATIETVKM